MTEKDTEDQKNFSTETCQRNKHIQTKPRDHETQIALGVKHETRVRAKTKYAKTGMKVERYFLKRISMQKATPARFELAPSKRNR